MFILDTDHLSIIERRTGDEYARIILKIKEHGPGNVFVTVPSMHEQFLGWHNAIARCKNESARVRPYRRLAALSSTYFQSPMLEYTDSAAQEFQRLRGEKVRINTMDLRIASIALLNQMTIVTRNQVDYERVPGLHIEDWTKERNER
jgi:tRNA(fMet)-specific endonuclease VapC